MAELHVAAGLVMNDKTRAQQGSQYLPGPENRNTLRHLSAQSHAQLFGVCSSLVGDGFARLLHTFQVTADGVASHGPRLSQRAPVGD